MALNRNHIKPETAARRRWCVTPPFEAVADDLCDPEYWKHTVQEIGLQPNDLVDATCEDRWYATYIVLHVGPRHAKLQKLSEHSLAEVTDLATTTDTLEVKYRGPAHRYVVRRISDGETIKHGFKTELEATEYMHRQARNIAAAA